MLRLTYPVTRINSDLQCNQTQKEILNNHWHKFAGATYQHSDIVGENNDIGTRFNAEFMHKSFVYVVTETVGDYPYAYFTEKTWKGIATGCPWLMIGARYSIKQLQTWGFKSFSTWWDEGYDQLPTVVDRIQAVTEILIELQHKNLHAIKQEMQLVLEYNQRHLLAFRQKNLNDLSLALDAK